MARQDQANDQFSLTSFLYGGNADYIEELYASYQDDPSSVDAEWQAFFAALKDDSGDVRKQCAGRLLDQAELAGRRQWRTGLGARRQLGPGRKGHRQEGEGQGRRRAPASPKPTSPGRRAIRCAPS
jgi:hypothetical protein